MTALPSILFCLAAAEPVEAPVPPLPKEDVRLVMWLLLDEKDVSEGVRAQIARKAMEPPYDASTVAGVRLKVQNVQGFDRRSPGWRISGQEHFTPILTHCPCCSDALWEELTYRVKLHAEHVKYREHIEVYKKREEAEWELWDWGDGEIRHVVGRWERPSEEQYELIESYFEPPYDWPVPPSRRIVIRDVISPAVWAVRP